MKENFRISLGGKIEVNSRVKVTQKNLSQIYTPGVAEVSKAIIKDKRKVFDYTWKKNTIAVVSDGSAILGLGNHGPEAALPVMEGKAVLFKELGGVDAVPIVLATQDSREIVRTVELIAPGFGGINLEDIKAPECFLIEEQLKQKLDIPVFHDDQHGTAIVVLAGLINALKVVKKKIAQSKIVISGAGAAGIAITKILLKYGANKIIIYDSQGPIFQGCKGLNSYKKEMSRRTNEDKFKGSLSEALKGADVFIGVSKPELLKAKDIAQMNQGAIVFAMANPIPEIMPKEALKGGARVIATGRSDFPNQVNNALVFPGIFKGALRKRAKITDEIKLKSAEALSAIIERPNSQKILPKLSDKKAVEAINRIFDQT